MDGAPQGRPSHWSWPRSVWGGFCPSWLRPSRLHSGMNRAGRTSTCSPRTALLCDGAAEEGLGAVRFVGPRSFCSALGRAAASFGGICGTAMCGCFAVCWAAPAGVTRLLWGRSGIPALGSCWGGTAGLHRAPGFGPGTHVGPLGLPWPRFGVPWGGSVCCRSGAGQLAWCSRVVPRRPGPRFARVGCDASGGACRTTVGSSQGPAGGAELILGCPQPSL